MATKEKIVTLRIMDTVKKASRRELKFEDHMLKREDQIIDTLTQAKPRDPVVYGWLLTTMPMYGHPAARRPDVIAAVDRLRRQGRLASDRSAGFSLVVDDVAAKAGGQR